MTERDKVLLVDDELEFVEVIAKFFLRRGIPADTSGGCGDALEKFGTGSYDVVIMDMLMPERNGIECMEEMKKMQPDIKVIILTGHGTLQSGLEGMKKGAFDYCLKPLDMAELLEKVLLARKH
jgi:DNA-binding NtrC family response regulator